MSQLTTLRSLLEVDEQTVADDTLQFYLDNARDIICDIRNTDIVETKYLTTQIKMAIEMFSKRGAEGESSHNENGIMRSYSAGDISPSLLSQVSPVVKTPFSTVRVVTP